MLPSRIRSTPPMRQIQTGSVAIIATPRCSTPECSAEAIPASRLPERGVIDGSNQSHSFGHWFEANPAVQLQSDGQSEGTLIEIGGSYLTHPSTTQQPRVRYSRYAPNTAFVHAKLMAWSIRWPRSGEMLAFDSPAGRSRLTYGVS